MISCSQCGTQLGAGATFCPMCGQRVATATSSAPQALASTGVPSLASAPVSTVPANAASVSATPVASNAPTADASGPVGDGWMGGASPPAPDGVVKRTIRLDPEEASRPMQLPRPALSPSVRRLPGAPARIPITPRPSMIIAGAVLLAVSLWALIGYLPSERPAPAEQTAEQAALLSDTSASSAVGEAVYIAGSLASVGLLIVGLSLMLAGALYRAQTEVMCRTCNQQVVGWKTSFGLMCPLGKHYARVRWMLLGVTLLFWLTAITLVVVVAIIVSKA